MTNEAFDRSTRHAAKLAGYCYLVIAALSLFANFFAREALVDPGSASRTARSIANAEPLFRAGIASFTVVFVLDVVITWALFVLFRRVDAHLSLLGAWFRLVYTTILGACLLNLLLVVNVLGDTHFLAFDGGQSSALVLLFLDAFNYGWLLGLVCFGAHLIIIGRLLSKSTQSPRALPVMLTVAGIAYIGDTFANILLVNYRDFEWAFLVMVAVPSLIGELWLAFWLIARGQTRRAAVSDVSAMRDGGSTPSALDVRGGDTGRRVGSQRSRSK